MKRKYCSKHWIKRTDIKTLQWIYASSKVKEADQYKLQVKALQEELNWLTAIIPGYKGGL